MTDYRQEIDSLQSRLQALSAKHDSFYSQIDDLKSKVETLRELIQFRLDELQPQQHSFLSEIGELKSRLDALRNQIQAEEQATPNPAEKIPAEPQTTLEETVEIPPVMAETIQPQIIEVFEQPVQPAVEKPATSQIPPQIPPQEKPQPEIRKPEPVAAPVLDANSSLEKYIGQNLIPVIGIIITVIGVGIGAKYAIDHQLISPLTRILLGYLAGGILLFFSLRLKNKYKEFSAILLSGSMAIFYFITFFAYSFYALIPLPVTFLMMVAITGFTVYSAIKYNLQIIAHIGLVGAYAVPFMLNNGSGRIGIFFSYMSFINIGILAVSFFRNWKPLYYVTFGLTWFIFVVWFASQYQGKHFMLAMIFLTIFFLIFYATNLAYKLIKKEKFDEIDGMMIIFNSLIFYGMGMTILSHQSMVDQYINENLTIRVHEDNSWISRYMSWFTLLNSGVHFIVAIIMYRRRTENRQLFLIPAGFSLMFLTIFIPIEFGGHWLTLLWIFEAGLLFWIGRTQVMKIYEMSSHIVMALAFLSLCINYSDGGNVPFWNMNLLTSSLFVGVLYSIRWLSKDEKYVPAYHNNEGMFYFTNNLVYVLMVVILFFSIQLEISAFWDLRYEASYDLALNKDYFYERGDRVMKAMGTVSNVLYALGFISVMAFLKKKQKNPEEFNIIFVMAFMVCIFLFLTLGLYELNFMHLKHLHQVENTIYYRGFWLIGVRYISYAVMAFSMYQLFQFVKNQLPSKSMLVLSEYMLHTVIVWCCSAELVNWVHSTNSVQAYKLALSIFAGFYALFLIALGIWKQKSYLRIGAISLFGITLLKLFFYDIQQMDTIFKTVVFISLGMLLLVIAFLYNKFKGRMFGE